MSGASVTPASTGLSRVVEARGLFLLEAFVALNAVGGALYGLLGADRVPRAWLEGSPFDSYVVPSLVLLVAVGGSMGAAAALGFARHPAAPRASIVAGLVLMGWILVQVVVLVPNGGFSWLQPALFAAGALVAALGARAAQR